MKAFCLSLFLSLGVASTAMAYPAPLTLPNSVSQSGTALPDEFSFPGPVLKKREDDDEERYENLQRSFMPTYNTLKSTYDILTGLHDAEKAAEETFDTALRAAAKSPSDHGAQRTVEKALERATKAQMDGPEYFFYGRLKQLVPSLKEIRKDYKDIVPLGEWDTLNTVFIAILHRADEAGKWDLGFMRAILGQAGDPGLYDPLKKINWKILQGQVKEIYEISNRA